MARMWMLPPACMCGRHRSGEHNELHKHLPHWHRGVRIDGRMHPIVQIELHSLQQRHDELVATLNHNSPLRVDDGLIRRNYPQYYGCTVDLQYNVQDLAARCPKCKTLIEKYLYDGGEIG